MMVKRPALVFLERLDLNRLNDRIIDAIWVHKSSQVAQVDPLRAPVVWIVAAKRMGREQDDRLPVLPNLYAMLQSGAPGYPPDGFRGALDSLSSRLLVKLEAAPRLWRQEPTEQPPLPDDPTSYDTHSSSIDVPGILNLMPVSPE
jgi:hypothetical protein